MHLNVFQFDTNYKRTKDTNLEIIQRISEGVPFMSRGRSGRTQYVFHYSWTRNNNLKTSELLYYVVFINIDGDIQLKQAQCLNHISEVIELGWRAMIFLKALHWHHKYQRGYFVLCL